VSNKFAMYLIVDEISAGGVGKNFGITKIRMRMITNRINHYD